MSRSRCTYCGCRFVVETHLEGLADQWYCPYCGQAVPKGAGFEEPKTTTPSIPAGAAERAREAMSLQDKWNLLMSKGWRYEGQDRWRHPGFDDDTTHPFEVAWAEQGNTR